MNKSGKTGRRLFEVSEWADYVRFQEKKFDSVKFEDPEEQILETKAIEEVNEIYVVEYGGTGEKQIIESGVWFADWNRAQAWAEEHADGDDWRIESLSRIDPEYEV